MSNDKPILSARPGILVVFEGPDGVGKSSVLKEVADKIQFGHGIIPYQTKQPGGTALGAELRKLILDPSLNFGKKPCGMAKAMMLMADKFQHYDEIIQPWLISNHLVLCDRMFASFDVYNECYHGIDFQMSLGMWVPYFPVIWRPNLTIFLDADADVCKGRVNLENSYDERPIEDYRKVAESYRRTFAQYRQRLTSEPSPKRLGQIGTLSKFVVVNANKPFEDVVKDCYQEIGAVLSDMRKLQNVVIDPLRGWISDNETGD